MTESFLGILFIQFARIIFSNRRNCRLKFVELFLSLFFFSTDIKYQLSNDYMVTSNATTIAGSPLGLANSTSTYLNTPRDVFVDQNSTIYVLDHGNYRVQRFFPNSTIGTTVINGTYGSMLNQFNYSNSCLFIIAL